MAQTEGPTFVSNITDEDLVASFSGPAVLSNKIVLTKTPSGVRLAFLEMQVGKMPPSFRAGVILGYENAIALKDLLILHLKEIEVQIKGAVKASQERHAAGAEAEEVRAVNNSADQL